MAVRLITFRLMLETSDLKIIRLNKIFEIILTFEGSTGKVDETSHGKHEKQIRETECDKCNILNTILWFTSLICEATHSSNGTPSLMLHVASDPCR